jgi:hypothetical protein
VYSEPGGGNHFAPSLCWCRSQALGRPIRDMLSLRKERANEHDHRWQRELHTHQPLLRRSWEGLTCRPDSWMAWLPDTV